jgi:putative aldouronate transport system substrate-binding protein
MKETTVAVPPLTRRRFLRNSALAAGTALGAGTLLAACASPTSTTEGSTRVVMLAPGDQPTGWQTVLNAVNTKLRAEKNLTLQVQWIGWTNYGNQTLLKYTSGEHFDASLDATWLHITQLIADNALLPLDSYLSSGKYPHLQATISPQVLSANTFFGKTYGIPQVNTAGSLLGFMTRKDLADKYGITISTYEDFERYLYAVKQHERGMIPFGLDNGYVNNTPQLFNRTWWQQQPYPAVLLSGNTITAPYGFIPLANPHAAVQPFWDLPGFTDFLQTVRRYYQDGVLNHDVLSVDKNEIYSLYGQGKYAAAQAGNDGLATTEYGATLSNVSGSALELVLPFSQSTPKPASNFNASNLLVINKHAAHPEAVLALQDWLSIPANHDLLEYGVTGKDWQAVGAKQYKTLDQYAFPGYVASWRASLERTPASMLPSDLKWFTFSQQASNFTPVPTAAFQFDPTTVKTQVAQLNAAFTQYALPLFAGSVDPTSGLAKLQQAFTQAGIEQVLQESQKQLTAFLATQK